LTYFLFIQSSYAEYDPCKFLKLNSCGNRHSVSKTTGASQPTSTRSFSDPSSLAAVKGNGLETIIGEGMDFSLVSGNGKVGGGISGVNSDDTFFGNTAKELTFDYETRKEGRAKYDAKKYSLGAAFVLLGDKKSNYSLNLGAMAKFGEETGKLHPGAGVSAVLGPINFGYSFFRDEGQDTTLNNQGEREDINFNVESYSLGVNLPYISVDYTVFMNHIDSNEKVEIYSGGFFYYKWMFSYARKKETSDRRKYDYITEEFTDRKEIYSTFLGIQYRYKKKLVIGILSNYYHSEELSLIFTSFF
jgi:hypothetical protein